ncbi:MAG: hypothetical protein QM477_09555, partial [Planctomycetota bacterium]
MQTLNSTTDPDLDKPAANYLSILLGQLPLSVAEAKVVLRLSHALGKAFFSIQDFLKLDVEALEKLDGIGVGYLDRIERLQQRIPTLGLRHWAALGHAESKQLQILEAKLTAPMRKSLEKLKRCADREPSSMTSAASLLEINYDALELESSWGGITVSPLRELCHAICQRLGGMLSEEAECSLPPFFLEEIDFSTAAKIDAYLASSIPSFLDGLKNPRSKLVLEARMGISRERATLETVGSLIHEAGWSKEKITRERVRQIEQKERDLLYGSLHVPSKDVVAAANPNPTSKPADFLPQTAALFHSNELFLDFLADWSGKSKDDLRKQETEGVFRSLFPLFETVCGPYSKNTLVENLREAEKDSEENCREKIRLMVQEGLLHQSPGGALTPVRLPVRIAVPNFYLETDSGLHWAEAMEYMEEADSLSEPFPAERAFQVRVQSHPQLYYCGPPGTYRHRKYHQLPDSSALPWIRFVKSRLGEKAENLRYWFHKQNLYGVVDYHELRDIINRLGEKEGLYFWGQSRRETLALDPNAASVPNDAVIIDFLETEARPLTRLEIHQGLPFIEDSTLDMQLTELTQAGRIRKTDLRHWTAVRLGEAA